jgi:Restriction endonuclease XhoI
MTDFDERLNRRVGDAVRTYWKTRLRRQRKQGTATGTKDQGLRSAVTGGAHLDGFVRLVADLLQEGGLRKADVFTRRRETVLPGYFRPTKAWDLVAVADGGLVACVEFKSQAGPSFGNNFNNRVEEALGNAADLWKAMSRARSSRHPGRSSGTSCCSRAHPPRHGGSRWMSPISRRFRNIAGLRIPSDTDCSV